MTRVNTSARARGGDDGQSWWGADMTGGQREGADMTGILSCGDWLGLFAYWLGSVSTGVGTGGGARGACAPPPTFQSGGQRYVCAPLLSDPEFGDVPPPPHTHTHFVTFLRRWLGIRVRDSYILLLEQVHAFRGAKIEWWYRMKPERS